MKAAVHAVKLGMPIRAAARKFDVSRSTLSLHHRNPNLGFRQGGLTRLLPEAEIVLKSWIDACLAQGQILTSADVFQKANEMLQQRDGANAKMLGRTWLRSFMGRQSVVLSTHEEKEICDRLANKPIDEIPSSFDKIKSDPSSNHNRNCRCCFRLLKSKRKSVEITETIAQKFYQLTSMKVSKS